MKFDINGTIKIRQLIQAITWRKAIILNQSWPNLLSIGPFGTNLSEIRIRNFSIHEKEFENVISKMAAILYRSQSVKGATTTGIATHCDDVIMGTMASQITSLPIVYSTVYSGADQRKRQSSVSLASDRWIPRRRASNAENVSFWWRHHVHTIFFYILI